MESQDQEVCQLQAHSHRLGEWGQDLRLEGWGREGEKRAQRARQNPRPEAAKHEWMKIKPGSPELSPKITAGP